MRPVANGPSDGLGFAYEARKSGDVETSRSPVRFGCGRRLVENLNEPLPRFRTDSVLHGTAATPVRYVRDD